MTIVSFIYGMKRILELFQLQRERKLVCTLKATVENVLSNFMDFNYVSEAIYRCETSSPAMDEKDRC